MFGSEKAKIEATPRKSDNKEKSTIKVIHEKYDFLMANIKKISKFSRNVLNTKIEKEKKEITIIPENTKTIGQTVKINNPDIQINEDVINATKEVFYNNYIKNPENLIQAYSRMGPWEDELKKMFKQAGIPKDFVYLAITESGADPFRVSPVGAVGPYQIMKKTASDHCRVNNNCLAIDGIVDERRDWIEAGKFCIALLQDAYNRTSPKETPENRWKLALSSYNGAFFWSFISQTKKENVTYENFNKYIEDNLKKLQDKARNSALKYIVKKGDTIEIIAKRYKISADKIKKYNKIKKSLRAGQKLILPLSDERVFEMRAKFYRENLKYPPKLFAALDAIKYLKNKENLEQEPNIKFQVKQVRGYVISKEKLIKTPYKVKPKDTIESIAKKFKVNAKFLATNNNLLAGEKLKPKSKIIIAKSVLEKKKATFLDYYNRESNKGLGFTAEDFSVLNAKFDKNSIIPNTGITIKYPKIQYGLAKGNEPEKIHISKQNTSKEVTVEKDNLITKILSPKRAEAATLKNENIKKKTAYDRANISKNKVDPIEKIIHISNHKKEVSRSKDPRAKKHIKEKKPEKTKENLDKKRRKAKFEY